MRTQITLLFALLLTPLWVLASEPTKDTFGTVKKATADKTAVLVDVREADEWKAGHVAGATFFPLSELKEANAEAVAKKLPKDKVIYTHCRAGRRALVAAELLEKMGYDVRPLKPGFEDIIKAGFPKETGGPPK